MLILCYYLYSEEEYAKLFKLLWKTKNLEFLSLRLIAQLKINRSDLAE